MVHYSCRIPTLCKRLHEGRLVLPWTTWKVVRPPANLIICASPKVWWNPTPVSRNGAKLRCETDHFFIFLLGTTIPKSLILFRERTSRFSLQLAHPMSLDSMFKTVGRPFEKKLTDWAKVLNKTLTQFYLDSGRVFNPDDWLGRNPYHEASFDDQEEWMNK